MTFPVTHLFRTCIFAGSVLLTACSAPDPAESELESSAEAPVEPIEAGPALDPIGAGGELIVLTRFSPTSYVDADSGVTGYEYELVTRFAARHRMSVRFEVMPDIESLIAAMEAGEAHMAAASLTITPDRETRITFGPAYKLVREQLVCRRGGPQPRNFDALRETELVIVAGSSYVETLSDLQETYPGLQWQTRETASAFPLLEAVQNREIACTIADSHLVDLARRRLPELVVPLNLTEESALAWIVNTDVGGLEDAINSAFHDAHENGLLDELDQFWFGRFEDFDYVDVTRFVQRIDSRLDPNMPYFEAAAAEHDLDWRLLAAQSYQESHWDPHARSATGVRGMMMLTLPTAREVGVTDRLDAEQSIHGGAAYLANLYGRLPDGIPEEDRIWFALAAYNVGMGHLYDARRLAEQLGRDKNSWTDMAQTLPLLADPEHYTGLRYGYARGHEPVRYVEKIREYRDLLLVNQDI